MLNQCTIYRSLANVGGTPLYEAILSLFRVHKEFNAAESKDKISIGKQFQTLFKNVEKNCTLDQYVQCPTKDLQALLRLVNRLKIESPLLSSLKLYLGRYKDNRSQNEGVFVGGYTCPGKSKQQPLPHLLNNPKDGPFPHDFEDRYRSYEQNSEKIRYKSSQLPHWILSDPEISLSKKDRREDPW